ncbi:nectin-4-like [Anabas testudineus]|uniref:nectin-4-like n=1 Tax=Anabas testudineus TaxID=64144 RepID=UPI000E45A6EF|nr:nectin-4-like [Anabas testudineus]
MSEPAWTLFMCFLKCSSSEDHVNITAALGQVVSLPCRVSSNISVTVVEWSRLDLEPRYVFVYRIGSPNPDDQNPAFKNRVELEDSQMEDGDVSLILMNVTSEDRGRYKCRVVQSRTKMMMRIINLDVRQPGDAAEDKGGGGCTVGNAGPAVRVSVVALAVSAVVGFVIFRK